HSLEHPPLRSPPHRDHHHHRRHPHDQPGNAERRPETVGRKELERKHEVAMKAHDDRDGSRTDNQFEIEVETEIERPFRVRISKVGTASTSTSNYHPAPPAAAPSTTRPSLSSRTLSARSAMARSCVTSTIVRPLPRRPA